LGDKMNTIEVSYPQNVERLFETVLRKARLTKLNDDDRFALEISFVEAVNNALIHGNGKSSEKNVRIDYGFDGSVFELVITDQGDGFNAKQLPDPTENSNITKDSGRGVLLMHHYMDEVKYNKKGNQIKLKKKIAAVC
jgi:serine/threonine-protein kinase RsbW